MKGRGGRGEGGEDGCGWWKGRNFIIFIEEKKCYIWIMDISLFIILFILM